MPNRKTLEILVCPITKTGLRLDKDKGELISDRAKLAYKIKSDIPIMVPESARNLQDSEIKK